MCTVSDVVYYCWYFYSRLYITFCRAKNIKGSLIYIYIYCMYTKKSTIESRCIQYCCCMVRCQWKATVKGKAKANRINEWESIFSWRFLHSTIPNDSQIFTFRLRSMKFVATLGRVDIVFRFLFVQKCHAIFSPL